MRESAKGAARGEIRLGLALAAALSTAPASSASPVVQQTAVSLKVELVVSHVELPSSTSGAALAFCVRRSP